jgi:hypothetical protein
VITRDNRDEILILAEWILSENLVDGHYFNLIRGDARDPGLKDFRGESLKACIPASHRSMSDMRIS